MEGIRSSQETAWWVLELKVKRQPERINAFGWHVLH
jgi:hypothetical protein